MTTESRIIREREFVPGVLPWLTGASALALYLFTLERWVSLTNLTQVVQVAGWDWQPSLTSPLQFLLTYPLRWLPAQRVPLALNLFTALCACLTLVLLARSVTLLPHDRTPQQRRLERSEFSLLSIRSAWIPPVFAALVCGLQLTFWENATSATGEMLNLLVFAYVIRCLLEYRISERQSWLSRAALVYGVGMAGDWGMMAFLPLFLVALVWLRGLAFFNARFLFNTALFAFVGMLMFLLLPLVYSHSADSHLTFWQVLHSELATPKRNILALFNQLYWQHRDVAMLLGFPLLFVFVMSVRWQTFSGDSSPLGIAVANTMFHGIHILILLVCIWLNFDPQFSPRHSASSLQVPFPLFFLSLYYLSTLAIGYYSGYLLLMFSGKPAGGPSLVDLAEQMAHRFIPKAVWVLFVLATATLFYKNFTTIQASHQPTAAQYASLTAQSLPPQDAVVLSDDAFKLYLLQSALAGQSNAEHYVLLNTHLLPYNGYHRYLQKKHPRLLPDSFIQSTNSRVSDLKLIQVMTTLGRSNVLCYLEPSFGYYFEQFYLEPHGLTCQLKFYPPNQITPPPLTDSEIEQNEAFWRRTDKEVLAPLVDLMGEHDKPDKIGLMSQFMELAHLKREANSQASYIGAYYSRTLNYWGVQLQQNNRLTNAALCFSRAKELNPGNIAAEINLQYNAALQAGRKTPVEVSKPIDDQLKYYRTLQFAMNVNGPFDEPDFCYELGREFAGGGNYRQAAQQFERVRTLVPDNLSARLFLAQLFNLWRLPDKTLEVVSEIRTNTNMTAQVQTSKADQAALVFLEASAQFAKTNVSAADEVVQSALERYPGDTNLLSAAVRIYVANRQYTNALVAADKWMQIATNNVDAINSKGLVYMQLNRYADAIPMLTRALSLQTNNYTALLNRAISYLQSGDLEAAQADYQELGKVFPTDFRINFGLGEIAYRKKDTNTAILYYQNFLSNSAPNSAESKFFSSRLKELKPGSR